MRLSSWLNVLGKLAFRIHMHAIQYVRYICETSDISMEFWYVSHIYLTSWMVLSSPLQLSKMPYLRKLPDPGFALKEIAGLSENVSASCNHAQHRTWRYNVWIWIKYCSISESATTQDKNFEICEIKMWGPQNSSLRLTENALLVHMVAKTVVEVTSQILASEFYWAKLDRNFTA